MGSTVAEKDLYNILGVERDADVAKIKKAYKRMAMQYHPDRNKTKDAETKFKEIQQAYSVLSNPEKKQMYDQFGTVDPQAGFGGGYSGGDSPFGDFSDIFNSVFNSAFHGDDFTRGQKRVQQGRDLQVSLELTLEEVVQGCQKEITLNAFKSCKTCDGSGAQSRSGVTTCPHCNGRGSVQRRVAIMMIQEPCPHCNGSGEFIKNPCPDCSGQGRTRKKQKVKIDVPAGIGNDDTLRLANKGEAGPHNGPNGNLLVRINVKSHPVFERHGDNLTCQMPISFTTAALGGETKIPTIDGHKTIKIQRGFQSGNRVKITGGGVKNLRSAYKGDLFCTLMVETPQKLTSAQIDLLTKFDDSIKKNPKKHSPKQSSWLDRAKNLFK